MEPERKLEERQNSSIESYISDNEAKLIKSAGIIQQRQSYIYPNFGNPLFPFGNPFTPGLLPPLSGTLPFPSPTSFPGPAPYPTQPFPALPQPLLPPLSQPFPLSPTFPHPFQYSAYYKGLDTETDRTTYDLSGKKRYPSITGGDPANEAAKANDKKSTTDKELNAEVETEESDIKQLGKKDSK